MLTHPFALLACLSRLFCPPWDHSLPIPHGDAAPLSFALYWAFWGSSAFPHFTAHLFFKSTQLEFKFYLSNKVLCGFLAMTPGVHSQPGHLEGPSHAAAPAQPCQAMSSSYPLYVVGLLSLLTQVASTYIEEIYILSSPNISIVLCSLCFYMSAEDHTNPALTEGTHATQ